VYRGYTLEQLWGADFEQMFFLLVRGTFPTAAERAELQQTLVRYMQQIPDIVYTTILSLPYDANLYSSILSLATA
jgi:citrate synthase